MRTFGVFFFRAMEAGWDHHWMPWLVLGCLAWTCEWYQQHVIYKHTQRTCKQPSHISLIRKGQIKLHTTLKSHYSRRIQPFPFCGFQLQLYCMFSGLGVERGASSPLFCLLVFFSFLLVVPITSLWQQKSLLLPTLPKWIGNKEACQKQKTKVYNRVCVPGDLVGVDPGQILQTPIR